MHYILRATGLFYGAPLAAPHVLRLVPPMCIALLDAHLNFHLAWKRSRTLLRLPPCVLLGTHAHHFASDRTFCCASLAALHGCSYAWCHLCALLGAHAHIISREDSRRRDFCTAPTVCYTTLVATVSRKGDFCTAPTFLRTIATAVHPRLHLSAWL